MIRRFGLKLLAALLPVLLLVNSIAFTGNAEETVPVYDYFPNFMEVNADSVILCDSLRGQVLYGKNMDKKLHISLANKIMTAIITIERTKTDSVVTVSKEASEIDGAVLSLEPGEKLSVLDLLYAIMLDSYNDAAMALAEFAMGNHDDFVKLMNDKVLELDLKNTHFENATGLYDENQYTTAYDLAKLVRYAISNPTFNMIFAARTKIWTTSKGTEILINKNNMFWEYDGVDGGKVGYNEADKYSVVTTASKGTQRLIGIVLDTPQEAMFFESKELLRYGFENYRIDLLATKNQIMGNMSVEGNPLNLIVHEDILYSHLTGRDFIESVEIVKIENPTLPVNINQVMGNARFILEDGTIIDAKLYPDRNIPLPVSTITVLKNKILEHKDVLYMLYGLLAIEAIMLLYYLIKGLRRLFIRLSKRKSE
ncbi:MAG: D-alanyl-D-alanine carboxypeptidase [Eubacteriales bacterium]|nr:D-alanyl-D-alanine carboxypeptidase [Eubacteriales bacterium]